MCDYVTRKQLKGKKALFQDWILKVRRDIKKSEKIHFSFSLIGSGKRNMVVKKCSDNSYDLDYQIILTKWPKDWDINKKAKYIKDVFKNTFDKYKPSRFSNCEDSTQALTTKNEAERFGFDIIIVVYNNDNFYILYNKKNMNNANNKDYCWQIRSEMKEHRENFKKIKGSEMWNELRKRYKTKRCLYKYNKEKKSYQILNEAVNEVLEL